MIDDIIDNRCIKKHYPSQNLDDQLTFQFEADPNLCLNKKSIKLHFQVELDDQYIPDNAFASKLFGGCNVEINSQRVSYSKSK